MKVLIVEDEAILREAYRSVLELEGFTVSEATDGRDALAKLPSFDPDIILLDILMPEMDGPTFLKKSKLKQTYPKTKVIAFSNLSEPQKIDDMLKLGAHEHMLKSSLSPKELVETIRRLLATK